MRFLRKGAAVSLSPEETTVIEHAAAIAVFVVSWPIGAALCVGAIRLYLRAIS